MGETEAGWPRHRTAAGSLASSVLLAPAVAVSQSVLCTMPVTLLTGAGLAGVEPFTPTPLTAPASAAHPAPESRDDKLDPHDTEMPQDQKDVGSAQGAGAGSQPAPWAATDAPAVGVPGPQIRCSGA